jgi:predicted DNA-binding transcriptional regulator AlpA
MSAMLMKLPDVMRETALGRSSIYAAIKAGRFRARPVRIGRRAVTWKADEIAQWREALPRSIELDELELLAFPRQPTTAD